MLQVGINTGDSCKCLNLLGGQRNACQNPTFRTNPASAGLSRANAVSRGTSTYDLPPGWCTYPLLCEDGSYYCGITRDLPQRILDQAQGKGTGYTKGTARLGISSSHLPHHSFSRNLPRQGWFRRVLWTTLLHCVRGPRTTGRPIFRSICFFLVICPPGLFFP